MVKFPFDPVTNPIAAQPSPAAPAPLPRQVALWSRTWARLSGPRPRACDRRPRGRAGPRHRVRPAGDDTGVARRSDRRRPPTPNSVSGSIVAAAAAGPSRGEWETTGTGTVTPLDGATSYGSITQALARPIVGMAATPDGGGYWLVGADGGVFSFGDAVFHGGTGEPV